MATTFLVETGAGVADANTYAAVADADQYLEDHRNSTVWSGLSTAQKQDALRMASRAIDAWYQMRWKGRQVNPHQTSSGVDTQGLDWPRYGVVSRDRWWYPHDALPPALLHATYETALREASALAASEDLIPDEDSPGDLQSTRVKLGPIEEDMQFAGSGSAVKQFTLVDDLLRDLVHPSGRVRLG